MDKLDGEWFRHSGTDGPERTHRITRIGICKRATEGAHITQSRDTPPVFVRLQRRSLDGTVPPELLAALMVQPSDILRVGSLGFTAMLSDAQRLVADRHPVVAGVEDNPECLAPLDVDDQKPDEPDRYVAKVLRGVEPATVIAAIDPRTADVEIMGIWIIATLTGDQLNALRHTPGVDFIARATMGYPA